MKFKVLEGRHQEFVKTEVRDEEGNVRVMVETKDYPRGSTVETDIDLETRFNRPNIRKFQRLDDAASESDTLPQEDETDPLEGMTLSEMRELARTNGIDLGSARGKADVAAVLREHL